jgi:hypothetical protein
MKYYRLFPEVAGGLGKRTLIDRIGPQMVVQKLHYEFSGWDGDFLLKTSPCFIVARQLADALRERRVSGVEFDFVEISENSQFRIFCKDRDLPQFEWMKVIGKLDVDDVVSSGFGQLTVSEKALEVIRSFPLNNCEVYEFDKVPSDEERWRLVKESRLNRKS